MTDSIHLKRIPAASPHIPAESDSSYIKHVHCDGARFHVISYTTSGMKCSEQRCIMNKPAIKEN